MVRRAQLIGGRDMIYVCVLPSTKETLLKMAEERNRSLSGIAAEIIEDALMVAS